MNRLVIPVFALVVGLCGILWAVYVPENAVEACPWLAKNDAWLSLPSLSSMARALGIRLTSAPSGERDPETGLLIFTTEELARHDGSDPSKPLLLAVKGYVFDVTAKGSDYYGKGRVRLSLNPSLSRPAPVARGVAPAGIQLLRGQGLDARADPRQPRPQGRLVLGHL